VEDLPHFLLRCSRYSAIREHFSDLVNGVFDTVAFFNAADQVMVAHAVVSVLRTVGIAGVTE